MDSESHMQNLCEKNWSSFAPLLLRVALGMFCLRLGLWGYMEAASFKAAIEGYGGLSGLYLRLYTGLGPYLLVAGGGLLLLGLFTKIAALAMIVVFLPLLLGAGAVTVLEQPLILIPEQRTIYKDIVVLVAFASLLLSGPGALSLDNALHSIYGTGKADAK